MQLPLKPLQLESQSPMDVMKESIELSRHEVVSFRLNWVGASIEFNIWEEPFPNPNIDLTDEELILYNANLNIVSEIWLPAIRNIKNKGAHTHIWCYENNYCKEGTYNELAEGVTIGCPITSSGPAKEGKWWITAKDYPHTDAHTLEA